MTKTVTDVRLHILLFAFALTCLFTFLALPIRTQAAELSVQTAQLLPPGVNTCSPLQVTGFTPYIYNGALDAFEFTVADSSYVAIAGSAGKTDIPFNQMTRRIETSGALRVHADLASTAIGSGLTVRVTMLSAKADVQTVCISIISTTITGGGILRAPTPPAAASPAPTPAAKPQPKPTAVTPPAPTPTPAGRAVTATTGTTAATRAAVTQNVLKDICSAAGGAARLWFILLALYAIIVAAAVFGQPQLPSAMRSQEWVAAAIVLPFLILFGIWYFVESCRVSAWVPAIATLIALAGLAAAFWDRSKSPTNIINLPGAKT